MLHPLTRRGRRLATTIAVAGVLSLLTGIATAGLVSSLGVAKRTISGKSTTIVVDRRGDAVYELSGESLAHLQCVTSQCLKLWPPVEVRSAGIRPPVAKGVPGPLSILRRVKGDLYQVMLDRHPLYFYSGDAKPTGSIKGQGVNSFGGTWHVVKAG
ncbi:MAG: COG4315 family predicted lipoprotein [Solirubrobacteraceae bacterium]